MKTPMQRGYSTLEELDISTLDELMCSLIKPLALQMHGSIITGRRPVRETRSGVESLLSWGKPLMIDKYVCLYLRMSPPGLGKALRSGEVVSVPVVISIRLETCSEQGSNVAVAGVALLLPACNVDKTALVPKWHTEFARHSAAWTPKRVGVHHAISPQRAAELKDVSIGDKSRYLYDESLATPIGFETLAIDRTIYWSVRTMGAAMTPTAPLVFAERGIGLIDVAATLRGKHIPLHLQDMRDRPLPTSESMSKSFIDAELMGLLEKNGEPASGEDAARLKNDACAALALMQWPALVAIETLPVTRNALPAPLVEAEGLPFLLVAGLRLAMEPSLFGLSKERMDSACYELRERCIARWENATGRLDEIAPIMSVDFAIQRAVHTTMRQIERIEIPVPEFGRRFSDNLHPRLRDRLLALADSGKGLAQLLYGTGSTGPVGEAIDRAYATMEYAPPMYGVASDPFARARTRNRSRTHPEDSSSGANSFCPWPLCVVPVSARRDMITSMFNRVESHCRSKTALEADDSECAEISEPDSTNLIFNDLIESCLANTSLWKSVSAQEAVRSILLRRMAGTDPFIASAPRLCGLTDQKGESLLVNFLGFGTSIMTEALGIVSYLVSPGDTTSCANCKGLVHGLEALIPLPNARCGECSRLTCHECVGKLHNPHGNDPFRCHECEASVSS